MKEHWHWGLVLLAVGSMVWLWGSRGGEPSVAEVPMGKATASGPERAGGGRELVDPAGRFKLKAPEGWSSKWHQGEGSLALSMKVARKIGAAAEIEVRVSQVPPVSADELYVQTIRMSSSRRERVLDGRRLDHGGSPVVELTVQAETGESRSYLRFVVERGWLIQVRGTSSASSFAQHLPTFERVAASVRGR